MPSSRLSQVARLYTLYHVFYRIGEESEQELVTTAGHPFWVEEEQDWIYAKDLKPGYTRSLSDGNGAVFQRSTCNKTTLINLSPPTTSAYPRLKPIWLPRFIQLKTRQLFGLTILVDRFLSIEAFNKLPEEGTVNP